MRKEPVAIYDRFLVVDLEATCWKNSPPAASETIEIGAVLYQVGAGAMSEYQTFVRPKLQPQLSDFCKNLTNIEQQQVDHARAFPQAFESFSRWAESHGPALFTSWGAYDKRQFVEDCLLHGLPGWDGLDPHLNLKRTFSTLMDCTMAPGLLQALEFAQLPVYGTPHRGIDDARNVARLLELLIGRFGADRVQALR